jgi:hypothetical protein
MLRWFAHPVLRALLVATILILGQAAGAVHGVTHHLAPVSHDSDKAPHGDLCELCVLSAAVGAGAPAAAFHLILDPIRHVRIGLSPLGGPGRTAPSPRSRDPPRS